MSVFVLQRLASHQVRATFPPSDAICLREVVAYRLLAVKLAVSVSVPTPAPFAAFVTLYVCASVPVALAPVTVALMPPVWSRISRRLVPFGHVAPRTSLAVHVGTFKAIELAPAVPE